MHWNREVVGLVISLANGRTEANVAASMQRREVMYKSHKENVKVESRWEVGNLYGRQFNAIK